MAPAILDPRFRPYFDHLVDDEFPGRCFHDVISVEPQNNDTSLYVEEKLVDFSKLHIPYAGHTIVWEVRFDSDCPDMAPDFLFDDDNFTHFLNIDIILKRVPSLANWDAANRECLRCVVQELMNLYTCYQLQRLEKDGSPLSDECSKLMQEFELDENQLQVLSGDFALLPHYLPSATRPNHNCVSIMILHLEKVISYDGIPEKYQDMALQLVLREYSHHSVCLHINNALMQFLGSASDLEVPNFAKSDSLHEYFHSFVRIVHDSLSQVNESFKKREDFHLGIYHELKESEIVSVTPIDNNMPFFTTSSFLVEMNEYPITVNILTPSRSHGDPQVSVSNCTGKPHNIIAESAWDPESTVEAIISFVTGLIDENND